MHRDGQTTYHIVRRMRVVCWINKAANTHSESVILLDSARKQWLLECASVLRCTYMLLKHFMCRM